MSRKNSLKNAIPPRSALPLLAAGALIVAAAGCGNGGNEDTLTKAEVIGQGSMICKEAEQSVNELPQPVEHPFAEGSTAQQQQDARAFLSGYADGLGSTLEQLRALNAPEEDKELLDGYIDDTGVAVEKLREASEAPPQEVEPMANEAFGLYAEASSQTAEYGFSKGVCGAGNSS